MVPSIRIELPAMISTKRYERKDGAAFFFFMFILHFLLVGLEKSRIELNAEDAWHVSYY